MATNAETETRRLPVHKKGRERRRQIIEAATKRLVSRGMPGLVLRDIADEMGITHGNLQYYFATKLDLLRAIFDDEIEKFTTGMDAAIQTSEDPSLIISKIIDSNVEHLTSDRTKLWRILFTIADQDESFAEILKRENDLYEDIFAEQLRVLAPDTSEERIRRVSKIIRMVIDGMAIEFIYNPATGPNVEALKAEIKSMIPILLERAPDG